MIKKIQRLLKGPSILVDRINEIISAVNILNNTVGDGYIQVRRDFNGLGLRLNTERLLARIPKLNNVVWCEVIQTLTYPDPSKLPTDPLYLGYSKYRLRRWGVGYTAWQNNTLYNAGDKVTYPTTDDWLYECKTTHTSDEAGGIKPIEGASNTWWELQEEIEVEYSVGFDGQLRVLRECFPWYAKGEVVPIITRVVDNETRYFIWQTIQYAGGAGESSIRVNETDFRTMAVYK